MIPCSSIFIVNFEQVIAGWIINFVNWRGVRKKKYRHVWFLRFSKFTFLSHQLSSYKFHHFYFQLEIVSVAETFTFGSPPPPVEWHLATTYEKFNILTVSDLIQLNIVTVDFYIVTFQQFDWWRVISCEINTKYSSSLLPRPIITKSF